MKVESFFFQEENCKKEHSFSNGHAFFYSIKSVFQKPNQDCLGFFQIDEKCQIALVSDGMGGHSSGEKASKLTYECFEKALKKASSKTNFRELILDSIEEADQRIKEMKIGAGATIVAFLIEQDKVQFFNCGDSTGALYGSRGKLKYKTIEHSPIGFGIESGLITEDQSLLEDNIVSNGLGFQPMHTEVSQKIELSDGDIVLITSDGFSKFMSFESLSEVVSTGLFESRVESLYQKLMEQKEEKLIDDNTLFLFKYKLNK